MKLFNAFTLFVNLFCCSFLYSQPIDTSKIVSEDYLRQLVEVLASDSMYGRYTGSIQNLLAANFIADQFDEAHLTNAEGNAYYLAPFKTVDLLKTNIYFSQNVVGILTGRSLKDEIVIFCAHYDHIGAGYMHGAFSKATQKILANGSDIIFNGANDNATGVAALISLANYYSRLNCNERTVMFVAFSGEEQGLKGSSHFADQIDRKKVIRVINLEMLARPAKESQESPYVASNDDKKFAAELNTNLQVIYPHMISNYFKRDPFYSENLQRRSDHYSFSERRIKAFSIMNSSPKDIYYHTPDDEIETLNFKAFTEVVKMIALACIPYINPTTGNNTKETK